MSFSPRQQAILQAMGLTPWLARSRAPFGPPAEPSVEDAGIRPQPSPAEPDGVMPWLWGDALSAQAGVLVLVPDPSGPYEGWFRALDLPSAGLYLSDWPGPSIPVELVLGLGPACAEVLAPGQGFEALRTRNALRLAQGLPLISYDAAQLAARPHLKRLFWLDLWLLQQRFSHE